MSEAISRLERSISDARELRLGHMQPVQLATACLRSGLSDSYAEALTEVLKNLMSLSRELTESRQWLSASQEWFNSNVTEACSHEILHKLVYICSIPARTSRDLRNQLDAVSLVRRMLDETRTSFEAATTLARHIEDKTAGSAWINVPEKQSIKTRLDSYSVDLAAKPSETLALLQGLEVFVNDIDKPRPMDTEQKAPDLLLDLLARLKTPLKHVLNVAAYETFLADIETCAADSQSSEARIRLWNLYLSHRDKIEEESGSNATAAATVTASFEFSLPRVPPSPFTPKIVPRDMSLAWKVLAEAAGQHDSETFNARADIIDALKPGSTFQRHETLLEVWKRLQKRSVSATASPD